MKTLIFNGAVRKDGDTAALLWELVSHLSGEIRTISCHDQIRPCEDCRSCYGQSGCGIRDKMQEIYTYWENCDNIVLASPIWFSTLSGPLLSMASRLESLWADGYFRQISKSKKVKKGVILLVGGQEETAPSADKTALIIMRFLDVHRPGVERIYSLDTNNLPARKDEAALERCRAVAAILNGGETHI